MTSRETCIVCGREPYNCVVLESRDPACETQFLWLCKGHANVVLEWLLRLVKAMKAVDKVDVSQSIN